MGLESGNFISDLVITNPPTTDSKQQGDDHIRLIKTVLKNTFPNATRAISFGGFVNVGAGSRSVLVTEQNVTFWLEPGGGQTDLYMPTLAAADAGWECVAIRGYSAGSSYIRPPSGVIYSGELAVNYARRCIPGQRFRIFWTGGIWVVERIPRVPIGTVLEYQGAGLPAGYEWPNGQTLNTTLYPEFAQIRGGGLTQDHRGRVGAMADQGAGRIGGGFVGGVNHGGYDGVGGTYYHQLTVAELASHLHAAYIWDPTHSHSYNESTTTGAQKPASSGSAPFDTTFGATTGGAGTGVRVWDGGTLDQVAATGSNGLHNNVQPTLMTHFILVVE